jgi:hypothetical protein
MRVDVWTVLFMYLAIANCLMDSVAGTVYCCTMALICYLDVDEKGGLKRENPEV